MGPLSTVKNLCFSQFLLMTQPATKNIAFNQSGQKWPELLPAFTKSEIYSVQLVPYMTTF